jgi:hypothetical protein
MKIRNYLIPVFSVLALASCNYEQINTNIYGVTEEGMKTGGLLYGAPFMDMQKLVIPIGSPTESTGPGNDLANTDIMSAGNYIGYWGMNNNWNFNTEATWNFTDARMSYAYQNFYSKLFRAWNDIYKHTKNSEDPADKEVQAVANVVKVTAWLRATDVFGPIVYTNAGNGDIAPKLFQYVKYSSRISKSTCYQVRCFPFLYRTFQLDFRSDNSNCSTPVFLLIVSFAHFDINNRRSSSTILQWKIRFIKTHLLYSVVIEHRKERQCMIRVINHCLIQQYQVTPLITPSNRYIIGTFIATNDSRKIL